MAKASAPEKPQQLNPFLITLNGIRAVFNSAAVVGIVFVVLGLFSGGTRFISSDSSENNNLLRSLSHLSVSDMIVVACIILFLCVFVLVVGAMIHGIASYTASEIAKGRRVALRDAFNTVLGHFGNYVLLYVWMNVKIFLWTLLFIVPGVIAYYRYSFAGVVFFDKDLRLDAALKESSRLTKNGLITLIGADWLWNIITLGILPLVIGLANTSQLYGIYSDLDRRKLGKPGIHPLSWVALVLPFILFALFFAFIIFIALIMIGVERLHFS